MLSVSGFLRRNSVTHVSPASSEAMPGSEHSSNWLILETESAAVVAWTRTKTANMSDKARLIGELNDAPARC